MSRRIFFYVLCAHLFFIGWMVIAPKETKVVATSRLIVRTKTPAKSIKSKPQAPSPKKESQPVKKKEPPPKAPSKKEPPPQKKSVQEEPRSKSVQPKKSVEKKNTKTAPIKKEESKKVSQIKGAPPLTEKRKSFEEKGASRYDERPSFPKDVKKEIAIEPPPKLSIDSALEVQTDQSLSYVEELALLLQESLELPELGVVKLRLEIGVDGVVHRIATVAVESEKNRKYLEKAIPGMQLLPPREGRALTLTITFCNE